MILTLMLTYVEGANRLWEDHHEVMERVYLARSVPTVATSEPSSKIKSHSTVAHSQDEYIRGGKDQCVYLVAEVDGMRQFG